MLIWTYTSSQIGGDSYSEYGNELNEEYKDNTVVDPHGKNGKGDGGVVCYKCLRGGTLLWVFGIQLIVD